MEKNDIFLEFFGPMNDAVTSLSPAIGVTYLLSTRCVNEIRFENKSKKCSKIFQNIVDLGLRFCQSDYTHRQYKSKI